MDQETELSPPFLRYFDLSNAGFAWRGSRPEQIQQRRAEMNDVLIFDTLLTSGGIRNSTYLFPPHDVAELVRLLESIQESQYDNLKKESLVYLLLKWHGDGRENRFREDRCLPPHFTALADAYWLLDNGTDIPRAVAILSDARLNSDYASKIMHAISLYPNFTSQLVIYVRSAKPLLVQPIDIDRYALALVETSFLEAWQFQRTFNEQDRTRTRLLEKLFEWCVTPLPRRDPLACLLSFPLSAFEEIFLHKYVLKPPKTLSGESISLLRDLACVRLIQSGKHTDAVKLDHQFASSTLNESNSSSQDRRVMIRNLYDSLPSVERMLLDQELENHTLGDKPIVKPFQNVALAAQHPAKDITIQTKAPRDSTALSPINHILDCLNSGKSGLSNSKASVKAANPALPISAVSSISKGIGLVHGERTTLHPNSSPFSGTNTATLTLSSRKSTGMTGVPQLWKPNATQVQSKNAFKINHAPMRQPNAFYNPPTVSSKRSFEQIPRREYDLETDGSVKKVSENEEIMEIDQDTESPVPSPIIQDEESDSGAFQRSLFGNSNGVRVHKVGDSVQISSLSRGKPSRQLPPGAFVSDEEGAETSSRKEEEQGKQTPDPVSAPSTRSRRLTRPSSDMSAGTRTPVPVTRKLTRRSSRQVPGKDLSKSIPGSLIPDDDDEDGDEDDNLGPIRHLSPKPRHLERKGRMSSTSDMGDDDGGENGVQTRRRSKRRPVVRAVTPERAVETPRRKVRKGTSAAASKKKR